MPADAAQQVYTLPLEGHTARYNEFKGNRWKESRLKKRDREWVAIIAKSYGIPPAIGKRRVSVEVILGPRQRSGDEDNWDKSLRDALKQAKLIKDDSPKWLEWERIKFVRGKAPAMRIRLEDVPPAPA